MVLECDDGYSIVLTSNSPVMRGAVGRFRAEALYMGQPAEGSFKYEWDETSIKQNKRIVIRIQIVSPKLLYSHLNLLD